MKPKVYTQREVEKLIGKQNEIKKKVYKDAFQRGVDCCSNNIVPMALIILQDKFQFTPEQAKRFEDYLFRFSDSVAEGRVTFEEIKEEADFELKNTDWSDLREFRRLGVTPESVQKLINQRAELLKYVKQYLADPVLQKIIDDDFLK